LFFNEFEDVISKCESFLLNKPDVVILFVKRQKNKITHSIVRVSLPDHSPHIFYIVPTTMYPLNMHEIN